MDKDKLKAAIKNVSKRTLEILDDDDDFCISSWVAVWGDDYAAQEVCIVCYGQLMDEIYDSNYNGGAKITDLYVIHPDITRVCRPTAEFVMNDLFQDAFLTKTLEDGVENGFRMDLTQPDYYMLGAMIALRACFNPWYTPMQEELLILGATPLEAIYVAERAYIQWEQVYSTNYIGDHCVFGNLTGLTDLAGGFTLKREVGSVWEMFPERSGYIPRPSQPKLYGALKEAMPKLLEEERSK